MSFTSIKYLVFLAVAAMVYYITPKKLQNAVLLLASLVFYMWAVPEYGILVLVTVGLCYGAGLFVEKHPGKSGKAVFAAAAILVLGILFVFKYYNFFAETVAAVMGTTLESGRFSLALPVGISFYTFTVLGYLSDVKNGRIKAEKNFIDFALFVSFFPAILSGPIGRGGELLPQLKKERTFNYDNVREGLQRFLTGAFRKVVLADGIGVIVHDIANAPEKFSGLTAIAAVLLYGIEMYNDFAGYTDMAVGSAKILGINIRENFAVPYMAGDITGFWSRWHMSLTSWFRDYIYIPLGGNRKGKARKYLNILIIFLVSGLWHGAGLGYIVWGLMHGVLRILEEVIPSFRVKADSSKLRRTLGCIWVYIFWCVSVTVFSTGTGEGAMRLLKACFGRISLYELRGQIMDIIFGGSYGGILFRVLYFGIIIGGMVLMHFMDKRIHRSVLAKTPDMNPVAALSKPCRWAVYLFMEFSVMLFWLFTMSTGSVQFIYFGY